MFALVQAALLIFILRLVDISLYTLRLLMIVRDRKALAWVFSFVKTIVFLFTLKMVLSDLGNWLIIFAYAAGFASGQVVGMWIEEYVAVGFTHLRIISPRRGAVLTEHLRSNGYAVTELTASSKDGMVNLLNCFVLRKKAHDVEGIISHIDPEAFITAEAVRSVQHGFWNS